MMRREDLLSLGLGLLLVTATAELTAAATTESPVLFVGDFEDGKLVHGQHWNVAGNAPEITSEEVRAGHYAMKTTLDRDNSPINFRTEIRPLTPDPIKQKDYWYGFSIFLPKDFVADPVWQIVAQFHDNPDNAAEKGRNPMLAFFVNDGVWTITSRWDSKPTTIKDAKGKWVYEGDQSYVIGPYDVGVWTDWVLHVKWSYLDDGVLEIWQNGKLVVSQLNNPNCYNDQIMPFFKMGLYSGWKDPTAKGIVRKRVLYHDEFRMAGPGGSYADVAPGGKSAAIKKPEAPSAVVVQ
jgi:Polysaccharide lyase